MIRLYRALKHLAEDLADLGADWALVGGLALAVHAEARTTRDLDVVVSVAEDREAEQVVRRLHGRGYREHTLVEQEANGRLATVRFSAAGEGPEGLVIDLLFASSGIEPEIVFEAETVEVLPGLRLPVARVGHLLAMKLLAGRPVDLQDVRFLLDVADEDDITRARAAARLITERGYHRGQDLVGKLEDELVDHGGDQPEGSS